ncbi:MAG: DUF1016 family protein [Kiritimatiellae bacterium]|nr:DUF1016 family protein [Kiritimatiellia bacterium]
MKNEKNNETIPLPVPADAADYERWILSIKERVRHARLRALLSANAEQLALYWDIGRAILDKQEERGWGSKVVVRMSRDLRGEFPDMPGFSPRNLNYMRAFADAWRRPEIVQAPLAQLPWYHQIALLERLKSRGDRLSYAALAASNGWSRNVLVHHIELRTADASPRALNNFRALMPPDDSDLAENMLKGEYDLGFLDVTARTRENRLRKLLVDRVAQFLVELGAGFAFVGKAVRLEVGDEEFELDLLFYHLALHRYVVVELKTGKFRPRDAGQLSFYMTAVDRQVKTSADGKTVGLLLCKSRDRVVVEYSLADLRNPIGVSTYDLGLPDPAQLSARLSAALSV